MINFIQLFYTNFKVWN